MSRRIGPPLPLGRKPGTVPQEVCQAIDRVIGRAKASMTKEDAANIDKLEKQFVETHRVQNRKFTLTWAILPERFALLGIPLKLLFEELGIEPRWETLDVHKMDDMLSQLPDADFQKVKRLLSSLSNRFWEPQSQEDLLEFSHLTVRGSYIIAHKPEIPRKEYLEKIVYSDSASLVRGYKTHNNRMQRATFSINDLAFIAENYNVSLAWLMGWADGTVQLWANSPQNEYIIAGYLFLPKDRQIIVYRYVELLLKGGGQNDNV